MAIEIDGALGEGGGQILRTALTLALCTGQAIAVRNIRAKRPRPGLMRQHLVALRAAQLVSDATVHGDELSSTAIEFTPGVVRAGDYAFAIGSAGSASLVLQTILPALLRCDTKSTVRIEGGTHNGMAPSVDFIERSFLCALAPSGIRVKSTLERHGFYPNGGGVWQVEITPWKQKTAVVLLERGELLSQEAVAKVSDVPRHVAEREINCVRKKLRWQEDELHIEHVDSLGPGNIVSLRINHAQSAQVFEAVGRLGLSAERVAGRAIAQAKHYLANDYVVGEYLADQLLLPMVMGAGGAFITSELSSHTNTNMRVIEQILGTSCIAVQTVGTGSLVSVHP